MIKNARKTLKNLTNDNETLTLRVMIFFKKKKTPLPKESKKELEKELATPNKAAQPHPSSQKPAFQAAVHTRILTAEGWQRQTRKNSPIKKTQKQ